MNIGRKLLLISGIGLVIGAVTPWTIVTTTIGRTSSNGLGGGGGDGLITGGIGIILIFLGLLSNSNTDKRLSVIGTLLSLLAGFLLFNIFLSIGRIARENEILIQTGFGLYISIISSIFGALSGLFQILKHLQKKNRTQAHKIKIH